MNLSGLPITNAKDIARAAVAFLLPFMRQTLPWFVVIAVSAAAFALAHGPRSNTPGTMRR